MKQRKGVTQSRLAELFDYKDGVLFRKVTRGNSKAGTPIKTVTTRGYYKVLVDGYRYFVHQVVWVLMTGNWPDNQIDHINGIKQDNRIENLRVCNTSTNCHNQRGPRKNNSLGLQGVHQIKKTGRYRATCTVLGIKHHLGVFATPEDASHAYQKFKVKLQA